MKKIQKLEMITGAGALEKKLARDEVQAQLDGLPQGHPLKRTVDSEFPGGEFAELPEGHPMRVEVADAKERYEQMQEVQKLEREQAKERREKRAEKKKSEVEQRRKEDEIVEKSKEAGRLVNKGIDGSLGSVKKLYESLDEHRELLDANPRTRVKMLKLERLLVAFERGISECRMR